MSQAHAYRRYRSVSMTRIDLILSLYDAILTRLDHAADAAAPDAGTHLAQCQVALQALAVNMSASASEVSNDFQRLYEYAAFRVSEGSAQGIRDAAAVLRTLREGFAEVRDQAVEMERSGQIPPLDSERMLQTVV